MALMANQVLEVVVKGRALGQAILNVVHYRASNPAGFPPLGIDIAIYGSLFVDVWRATMRTLINNQYTVETYSFRSLVSVIANPTPPPPKKIAQMDAFDIAGEVAEDSGGVGGEISATFVAGGFRKVTPRAGRRYRGNIRIGPLGEVDSIDNHFAAGRFLAWQTAGTDFAGRLLDPGTPLGDDELQLCVFSETSALEAAIGTTDLRQFTAPVTAVILNPFITSQVSRKASGTSPT